MRSASATPLEQLHGDERAPITFVDVIDRADVGMIEGKGRTRFPAKTFRGLSIVHDFIGQELQSHQAAPSVRTNSLSTVHFWLLPHHSHAHFSPSELHLN